jgi:hypothetical protein
MELSQEGETIWFKVRNGKCSYICMYISASVVLCYIYTYGMSLKTEFVK